MKKYKAMVNVGGVTLTTVVFAENSMFAYKLVQKLFGDNNIVSPPIQI
jgi:hypothetical protein